MFIEYKIPDSNFYFSQLCPWQQSTEDTISKMEVLDLSWPTTAEAPSALSPPMYPLGGPFKRGWKQSKMKHILCKERKKETCANMDTCNLYTTSQTQNLFPLLWFEPNHRFESLKKGLQNGYIWFVLPVQICLACTHICIWTLKGWIYELVYIMYLKWAGIMLQFCLTGIVRTAGGWRGEINESWTQLNRNLPLIPTRAVYIIIDSRVSGNCRPRLSEIKSWTTVINHDSPLKWSELSWIKPKQTGFFRLGHNNETFNWWVQSSNISP